MIDRREDGLTLVEMLIVMVILGVVASATTTSILSTFRSDQYTEELATVTEQGRVSMDRVRKELRGGRRILTGSDAARLYWWVDQDQDGLQDLEERVTYCVVPLSSDTCVDPGAPPAGVDRFRLVRFTDADPTSRRTLAETLTSYEVFSGYATATAAQPSRSITDTNEIQISLDLDVRDDGRGPDQLTIEGAVRLRNVA